MSCAPSFFVVTVGCICLPAWPALVLPSRQPSVHLPDLLGGDIKPKSELRGVRHLADKFSGAPPRYIFGVSTGHTGTTSLSSAQSYTGPGLRGTTFRFEAYLRNSPFGNGAAWNQTQAWTAWYDSRPSPKEQLLVTYDYKARVDEVLAMSGTRTYVDLGHHNLHGLVHSLPSAFGDGALFVRIRRPRLDTAFSFAAGKGHGICANMFRVCPTSDHAILQPPSGRWTEELWSKLNHVQQALWFVDEVEAEWQSLLRSSPEVSYIECTFVDDLRPCFEAVGTALGVEVANRGAGRHFRKHVQSGGLRLALTSDLRAHLRKEDERYRETMKYPAATEALISKVQF